MRGLGTVINVAAVILGGGLGMLLKGGLKKRYQEIMMQALGVCTIFIGLSGALKGMFSVENGSLETSGTMLLIGSLVAGALLGEWIQIEKWMDHFGEWLRRKVGGKNDSQFVEGFVSASLVICVGAMAIVGALEDGMRGDYSMLAAKAVLDAGIVLVFASTYGKGAVFSALPVGIWQGLITLFARFLEPVLTTQIISDLSFTGNVLIFCVGVNLAFGKRFRVGNMLPALLFTVFFDVLAKIL
ncbi:MAG: DUF554 domain-containing protein [Faecalicatena sp.]|uniref:DUF554 domain-containing protein n=1 Tax=Faecalicatena sp. TaxID=2005360 RepID=UPI0025898293|nr:DUF554 domain-containing protein [Faecalicatena sp.]MCI6466760.1 DUF554 domain-containing protein [Faecalicatena sp.]MDY5620553.1 DUF554 domain-containing protein [Lachnospiraceae bacterium]